jgi:hypothetical protein
LAHSVPVPVKVQKADRVKKLKEASPFLVLLKTVRIASLKLTEV